MQFGSPGKTLFVLTVIASLSSVLRPPQAAAQLLDQSAGPGWLTGRGPSNGAASAQYLNPVRLFGARQSPYMDANGNPVVVPAGYLEQCPGGCPGGYCGPAGCSSCGGAYGPAPCGYGPGCGPGCGDAVGYGGFTGPFPMGAGGTDPPIGYDLMEDVGVEGFLVDQRGPHYWDVRGEVVALERESTFGPYVAFTALGSSSQNIVLASNQLDYDMEYGFRIMGRYDICPLAVFEFGYTGIYDFESTASATSEANQLFSLFSRPSPGVGNFGVNPPGVETIGGPMPQSERTTLHTITIDSQLQTAEMTYRRYWVGYIPRVSGTLLAGFRYTRMKEDFLFHTEGPVRSEMDEMDPAASLDYLVRADNHLLGLQTGGDIWIGLIQGLRVGAEGKVGIYNNHCSVNNIITANPSSVQGVDFTSVVPGETLDDDQAALITEASLDVVADIFPSVSFRGGYEILFLNSIVLAGENFNTTSPYIESAGNPVGNQGTRVPFLNDQGSAFYHGWHAGIEYIW